MITIANFAVLVVSTLFAASAAVLLDWILLQALFRLMRPAAVRVSPPKKAASTTASELVHGTRQIARHFAPAAVRR
ncbi:MAG TPA: hypothetical protein VKD70_04660 [Candidatus Acidoferrum sp.]|nr:hypothetical protein [Candidatus Acidoferrum sp.]